MGQEPGTGICVERGTCQALALCQQNKRTLRVWLPGLPIAKMADVPAEHAEAARAPLLEGAKGQLEQTSAMLSCSIL